MKNSCKTRRGCETTIILPYGFRNNNVITRGIQRENVFKTLLPFPNANLYKKLEKKRQMEKRNTKTTRDVCILPNGVGTCNYSIDNAAGGYVNAYEYGNNFYND